MTTKAQRIAEILNTTGAYLQARVFEALSRGPYKVKHEYPFAINGKQGKADIVAVFQTSGTSNVLLLFEIKKADPDMKHWIFFKQKETQHSFFSYQSIKRFPTVSPPNAFYIRTWFPGLGNLTSSSLPIYDMVYEINDTWKSIFKRQDNAEKAMSQVNHGLFSCFSNFYKTQEHLEFTPENFTLFIPVVVTSANLYEAKFEPSDISLKTGEIDTDKFQVEEKEWIAYNYALEDYLQKNMHVLNPEIDCLKPSVSSYQIPKSLTFVVNSDHFDQFLPSLLKEICPH